MLAEPEAQRADPHEERGAGERWRWLPDLLSDALGLPAVGAPRERLELLDLEMLYRTGATVNWTGTYEAVVERLIRDREREAAWKR